MDRSHTFRKSTSSKSSTPKRSSIPIVSDNPVTPEEIENVSALLEGTSTISMKEMLLSDQENVGEVMINEGANSGQITFAISSPVTPQTPKPSTSKDVSSLHETLYVPWYPHKLEDNLLGQNTRDYLKALKVASNSTTDVFALMNATEAFATEIGCHRTIRLWTKLNPLLGMLKGLDMQDVAMDLCSYMVDNPDSLDPYLKCLHRVKPFLRNPEQSFKMLEDRTTALSEIMFTVLDSSKAHQDETIKFANQVTNVSKNLAGLQEVIEKTVTKVLKLDLLPSYTQEPSSEIQIPSTSSRSQGERVEWISLNNPGEYYSLYSLKINHNAIQSVKPPPNNPEIGHIVSYKPPIQEVFLNLDQAIILNKLSAHPNLKSALTMTPGPIKGKLLRELCLGISQRPNQWCKLASSPSSTI